MNTLAPVMPNAAPAPMAKPMPADDDTPAPGAFAQCMHEARQTQDAAPSEADTAAGDDAAPR
jgi:hypothetical protein